MAKILHTIYCNVYHVCSVIYYARYLNWGIISPMAIGWLFLEHSHHHNPCVKFYDEISPISM